jgi:TspO/MBR family
VNGNEFLMLKYARTRKAAYAQGKLLLKKSYTSYKRDIPRLAISTAVPLIAGAVSAIFTSEPIATWYPTIQKPSFNPPNSLFSPVWTILYILMGRPLFLIWTAIDTATTFHEDRRSRKIMDLFQNIKTGVVPMLPYAGWVILRLFSTSNMAAKFLLVH